MANISSIVQYLEQTKFQIEHLTQIAIDLENQLWASLIKEIDEQFPLKTIDRHEIVALLHFVGEQMNDHPLQERVQLFPNAKPWIRLNNIDKNRKPYFQISPTDQHGWNARLAYYMEALYPECGTIIHESLARTFDDIPVFSIAYAKTDTIPKPEFIYKLNNTWHAIESYEPKPCMSSRDLTALLDQIGTSAPRITTQDMTNRYLEERHTILSKEFFAQQNDDGMHL